jgi:hypothetical protein
VLQVEIVVHGKSDVEGASPLIVSALTKTGMTDPVLKENVRWPRTISH